MALKFLGSFLIIFVAMHITASDNQERAWVIEVVKAIIALIFTFLMMEK